MTTLKILSLDGGGVRGYLTTIILANIEIALKAWRHFFNDKYFMEYINE